MQSYAKIFILIAFDFLHLQTWAAVSKFAATPTDKLQISLAKAQVTVSKGQDGANIVLQTAGNCREFLTENQSGIIKIYESDLLKPRSENSSCQLQIFVPLLQGIQIHLFEGSLTVQKLGFETLLHLQKGKVNLKETTGNSLVYVQKGEVLIQDCQGQFKVDIAQAQLNVRNLQGDLDAHILSGDLFIEKSKGQLRLNQSQGSGKILNSAGSLQFETNKAVYTVESFGGRIDGQSQEGALQLKLVADFDAHIKTTTARSSVQVPKGMLINALTQEGELIAPTGMSTAKEGSSKSLRGRVPGDAARGSVTLRSQEGGIFLK